MGTSAEQEYAAFEERVSRTVYFDNLSPLVTESVLKSAFEQFATVKSVTLIPNYTGPSNFPQCALVELDSAKKVGEVLSMVKQYPFMICGMPRPVRARQAEVEMFDERPVKPGRKITCRWLEPSDPDFEVAKGLKRLTCKHAAEAAYLAKLQLGEEEKLAKQQMDTLKGHYKKYELIRSIIADGNAQALAERYNLPVSNKRLFNH
ncbi:hypothetical protein L6164_000471 [Bauhinia variegata]|uniref:Uncharacterized protein n=1 Tax=Bauhinia variegata TaxID=167791 RepID=A0ACB9Q8P9_BAUVA|nr:hypothetical protein L6164_000471 [Bauhinia variegata]